MRTIADYRQLNDALFHAGFDSGSEFEWEDQHNRLHFYVVDLESADDGILTYTLAVRSLDGAGSQERGVALDGPEVVPVGRADTPIEFTLTNPGAFGGLYGLPIINQPQVAILGIGGIEKRPVVIDDAIAIRSMMYVSMSYDHRVVDGAVADQFLAQVKQALENFDESLL